MGVLVEKIAARKNFLKPVVPFVEEITLRKGTIISQYSRGYSSFVARKLDDFGGFMFITKTGTGPIGGESVEVWFNTKDQTKPPCLRVTYMGTFEVEDCKVEVFEHSLAWRNDLVIAMVNKDRLIVELEEKKRIQENAHASQTSLDRELQRLMAEARRLGIYE